MESCTSMLQLKQIQAHMTKNALITHTFPASRVLAFCALSDSGDTNHAHLLFSQLQKPNTSIWNTMIRGCSRAKTAQTGVLFFCQMVQKDVEMDCRSFVFAFKACEQFLGVLEGKSVHCVVWKMGFVCTLLVQNGLVHFYVRCASDVKPIEVTMIAVLSSCSQKRDLRLGKTFDEYVKTRNVTRSLNLMNAILDMYVKSAWILLERFLIPYAYELITKMPKDPSAAAWGALVHACRMHGNVEVAKIAAPRFLELDPKSAVSMFY
ncbi:PENTATRICOPEPTIDE REPEAT-CONTAINING PROTEIN [Salix purpurea]|uniref:PENTATRICOPEPTIDE REPEAT-CONTAINING PROTEIN n=1 Tax=Salix purpurea TaxID=77065 RepID=A0A9Q0YV71_SALPP|nr:PENTATRICOPEPTIDE REPEAT-CONTAINING PROTEIN [Salix purpurea]